MDSERISELATRLEMLHLKHIDECLKLGRNCCIEVAEQLRVLLLPILHRWGVGMQKGGAWVYPRVGDNSQVVGERVMRNILYSCYPLNVLHPHVFSLIWSPNKLEGKRVVDYMQPIPLPVEPVERVWITHAADFPACRVGTIEFPGSTHPPNTVEYRGPVGKSFYEDLKACGADIGDVAGSSLPPYYAGPDGTWVEMWEYGYDGEDSYDN